MDKNSTQDMFNQFKVGAVFEEVKAQIGNSDIRLSPLRTFCEQVDQYCVYCLQDITEPIYHLKVKDGLIIEFKLITKKSENDIRLNHIVVNDMRHGCGVRLSTSITTTIRTYTHWLPPKPRKEKE